MSDAELDRSIQDQAKRMVREREEEYGCFS